MRLKIFICFLLLSAFIISKAQDFENYQTLLSKGDMPDDFKLMASEKYHKELEEIKSQKITKKTKNLKRNFALETNFAITDLMMSGRVIYGDALSNYVNKIADLILNDNKELREKLRFYIIKSTVSNALCTNQGIIFITSGLIAQVENEAQLAYIISHEIIHFTKQHNFESFKKREAILKGASRNSSVTIEEKVKSLYKYSKKNESEADEQGFELFVKTNYNPFAAYSSLDVLLYSYLPYDMTDWNPSYFETEYYKFPSKYTKVKVDEINADEDEDDALLTHPNIGKRKSNISYLINKFKADSMGKSLFLVSKDEFQKVQKIARYELASLYLKAGNPLMAYYIAYLLDNTYGAVFYTEKIKSMSIYSLARHDAYNYNLDNYGCDVDDYEGEIQKVAYFFDKIKTRELLVLAAKYLWEKSQKYPKDEQLQKLRDHAFIDMFAFYKFSTSSFLDYKPKSVDTTNENKTKVEKLKSKQKSKSDAYYLSAFYEFSKDNNFIEYLKNIYSKSYTSDIENEYNEILNDEDEDEKPNKNKKSKKKNIFVFFNKTESQQKDNINKIVMFKPEYSAILLNKIYPLDDELRQNQISEYYNSIANESGVNIELLDKLGQEDFNTESFNKYALIRDWFIERLNNDTLTMELYQKEFVKVAFAEYNTKYLGWAGYKFSLSNKEFNSSACSISLMLFPVFPIYLIWQLSKEKQLETLILIYDIETGKAEMIDYSSYNYKPKKSYLKAIIYNHIYYLKNEKQIN